jgi:hypothetical protein
MLGRVLRALEAPDKQPPLIVLSPEHLMHQAQNKDFHEGTDEQLVSEMRRLLTERVNELKVPETGLAADYFKSAVEFPSQSALSPGSEYKEIEMRFPGLAEGLAAFVRTSTLEDQINSNDADGLFRLGQYLVLLEWGRIQSNLDGNAAKSTRPS